MLLLALASACTQEAALLPKSMPRGSLTVTTKERDVVFKVAIAETEANRARGLMHVRKLDSDSGVVFLYDSPSETGFWMKNTHIELDIAFWDRSERIVDIARMPPCRNDPCRTYHSSVPYVGAIEVNAGVLAESGIGIGDLVALRRDRAGP